MGKFDEWEVWGEDRARILSEIKEQMDVWGLTMPTSVMTLVLHAGRNEFGKTGAAEFWVADEEEQGYCGKFLYVFDGQTCPYHCHKMKHETFYVVKGKISMNSEGKVFDLEQGNVFAMPQGTYHSFTGLGNALLLEVSKPSVPNDNFFADQCYGNKGVI